MSGEASEDSLLSYQPMADASTRGEVLYVLVTTKCPEARGVPMPQLVLGRDALPWAVLGRAADRCSTALQDDWWLFSMLSACHIQSQF